MSGPRSPETRKKISEKAKQRWAQGLYDISVAGFQKGHKPYGVSPEKRAQWLKKIGLANKGRKISPEARKKMSLAKLGKTYPNSHKGKVIKCPVCGVEKYKYPRDLRRVKTSFCSRVCAYKFQDKGKTSEKMRIRDSKEYKLWREAVFKRDNYQCIWCGLHGRKGAKVGKRVILHADHIKPFAYFPEVRFAIDNGRTLCRECHWKTDSYGNKARINYADLI